jgi:hypothetical protein
VPFNIKSTGLKTSCNQIHISQNIRYTWSDQTRARPFAYLAPRTFLCDPKLPPRHLRPTSFSAQAEPSSAAAFRPFVTLELWVFCASPSCHHHLLDGLLRPRFLISGDDSREVFHEESLTRRQRRASLPTAAMEHSTTPLFFSEEES